MTAEILARLGGPVGAAGIALVVLAAPRRFRIAGLALWAAGMALFLPELVPPGYGMRLALGGALGLVAVAALTELFRREPWALAFLTLAAVPARIPVDVGDTSANLLLPLYAVVVAGALAHGLAVLRGDARVRPLGPLAWPVVLLSVWLGLSALWTNDVSEGSITLFFFVLPFGMLAACLATLPWSRRALTWLFGLFAAMALLFAGVGIWQWLTRDVFWNPKIIVGNAYAPFYRVNSLFWDPSIYGRFLVVAILASLALLLFRSRPRWDPALLVVVAVAWVGLLFSFSQSSFFALVCGVALASVLAWRWRSLAALGLVAAVMIPLGVASPQFDTVREKVFSSSTSSLNRATSGRFELVTNGLEIAAHHPLAGVGVGGFKRAYAEREGLKGSPPRAASHNTPVSVAAETGVIGVALLGWLVAAACLLAFRNLGGGETFAAKTRIVAGLGLAAIFVHSQFYNAFFEDPMVWALLALTAVAAGAGRGSEPA